MAIMMAPFGHTAAPQAQPEAAALREVQRCSHCKLVQFRSASNTCKRCKQSLVVDKPAPAPAPIAVMPAAPAADDSLQVAASVREMRQVRNLSQRQLAARMNVPRTYISKIENGKAMPTLSSLDRLARALDVDISALLRDTSRRHSDEMAMLTSDPFLAELSQYTSRLDSVQKAIFLNQARELASGRRKTA